MRAPVSIVLAGLFLSLSAANAAEPPKARAKSEQTKLICKTGAKERATGDALKLYFNYNLPVTYEPEDPTMPYGRQMMLLSGRPVVQLFFEKAPGPAGENGEFLQPMQCAFARRAIRNNEPTQAQILLAPGKAHWISQGIGQRGAAAERAVLQPAGDWTFAHQFEQVFTLEIEDRKSFITSHLPRAL